MSKQLIGPRSLTRRAFLRHSAIAGAGLTVLPSLLAACAAPARCCSPGRWGRSACRRTCQGHLVCP